MSDIVNDNSQNGQVYHSIPQSLLLSCFFTPSSFLHLWMMSCDSLGGAIPVCLLMSLVPSLWPLATLTFWQQISGDTQEKASLCCLVGSVGAFNFKILGYLNIHCFRGLPLQEPLHISPFSAFHHTHNMNIIATAGIFERDYFLMELGGNSCLPKYRKS